MDNANILKGGVVLVLLLAALVAFDTYNNYAPNPITGAQTRDQKAELPDIEVTGPPTISLLSGGRIAGTAVIKNIGGADVTKPFNVDLIVLDKVAATVTVEGLKREQPTEPSHAFVYEFDTPFPLPIIECSSYLLKVKADSKNEIVESDSSAFKSNNERLISLLNTCPVSIEPGWNIIEYDTLFSRVTTTCSQGQLHEIAYSWNPKISDYDKIELDELFRKRTQILKGTSAVWLYNKGDSCTVNSHLYLPFVPIALQPGSNMIGVPSNFKGKTLEEVSGDCNVEYVWLYDPANAEKLWVFVTTTNSKDAPLADRNAFLDKDRGKGFWVHAEKECSFVGRP